MARSPKKRSSRSRREQRKRQEQRKQRMKYGALALLAALGLGGLVALMMTAGDTSDEVTYIIDDVSMSGELAEFIEPVGALAWIDAAQSGRDLNPGIVGGDTTDFELFDRVQIEAPCQTATDGCHEDLETEATTWATGFRAGIRPGSARGSDLVGPFVELDGAHGTLFYVTDGCIATRNPPQNLCRNLPADEEEAQQVGRSMAADYGIEGALENFEAVYLVGVGSTANGGLTGHDATMLRATLTALIEAAGVDPAGIHVSAGLPTVT